MLSETEIYIYALKKITLMDENYAIEEAALIAAQALNLGEQEKQRCLRNPPASQPGK